MNKAVLRIRKDTSAVLEEMGRRFASAWKSGRPASARVFSFESPAALFRVLSPKRWELIERLQALGPTSVRGLARALERDVKRVHEDVGVLVEVGLIEKTAGGKVQVPYAVIEADFALRAAQWPSPRPPENELALLPQVAEAVRNDPSIYPSEEVYRRLILDRSWSPEQMQAVNRVWTRIKAAR